MEQHDSRRKPFCILLHRGACSRLCHEIAANRHARGKRDGEQPIARLHLLNAVQRDALRGVCLQELSQLLKSFYRKMKMSRSLKQVQREVQKGLGHVIDELQREVQKGLGHLK